MVATFTQRTLGKEEAAAASNSSENSWTVSVRVSEIQQTQSQNVTRIQISHVGRIDALSGTRTLRETNAIERRPPPVFAAKS